MSYQVLARKWRPRVFSELVGQEHVVRALSHALDTGRIHHAFLFTGTRGVGKTTIARIFAKSLNCDKGVSATPCGECSACKDIDAGRFLDLMEIDAASRTRVDDTRELLDNVMYAPARGRYKVYLIDEVHMLSTHSFNALLKTLEEPPEHVKFLLATTDPQKLPVTVLSRCLQFNLKRLTELQISEQVQKILTAEEIEFDFEAVAEIAKGGNGSVRDALSLLDQAIAFGGGSLRAPDVRSMLGTIDRASVIELLQAVVNNDADALMAAVATAAEYAPDFADLLDALAEALHQIQLAQLLKSHPVDKALTALADKLAAEQVQLYYQIAITGRRDLALAPNPRVGLEMALLRMLAFAPIAEDASDASSQSASSSKKAPVKSAAASQSNAGSTSAISNAIAESRPMHSSSHYSNVAVASLSAASAAPHQEVAPSAQASAVVLPAAEPVRTAMLSMNADDWQRFVEGGELRGPAKTFASNVSFAHFDGSRISLAMRKGDAHLRNDITMGLLADALLKFAGRKIVIEILETDKIGDTLADQSRRAKSQQQTDAEMSIANDPFVIAMQNEFGARIIPNSTRPKN